MTSRTYYQALRLLLVDAGFEVDLVSSVRDVVDRIAQRSYDLLLMDLNYTRDRRRAARGWTCSSGCAPRTRRCRWWS